MLIPLTQGKFALIDKKDFKLISKYKWHYRKSGKTHGKNGYAQNRKFFMHNLIMRPLNGFVVDHINRNGLDNRRGNLRLGTISQNYANFPKKNGRSKYRGVHFLKRRKEFKGKPWGASTTINGKSVYIGVYDTEKEAGLAYNKVAKKAFGKFAQLNKI